MSGSVMKGVGRSNFKFGDQLTQKFTKPSIAKFEICTPDPRLATQPKLQNLKKTDHYLVINCLNLDGRSNLNCRRTGVGRANFTFGRELFTTAPRVLQAKSEV
jgi:hypothetical protein